MVDLFSVATCAERSLGQIVLIKLDSCLISWSLFMQIDSIYNHIVNKKPLLFYKIDL